MRTDYVSKPGTEHLPVEKAMAIFVAHSIATDGNYCSEIVKENLAADIAVGYTPAEAVRRLLDRAAAFHARRH